MRSTKWILRGGEHELRCQGCNKWLDERDLSCGLMQFCTDCCLEPGFFHESPAEDSSEDYPRS